MSNYTEYRNKFKDFIKCRRCINSDFFSVYEEFFGGNLGVELFFDSCMASKLASYDAGDVFEDAHLRIPLLCDELIKAGNIKPILSLALSTYFAGGPICESYANVYPGLRKLLKKSEQTINNKNIADICSEYIRWCIDKYSEENPEDDFDPDSTIIPPIFADEFICKKILGIDDSVLYFEGVEQTVVDLPEDMVGYEENYAYPKHIESSKLDKIISEKILNVYGKNTIASIGWLMSVCIWLNKAGFAYVSQRYILPSIEKTNFMNSVMRYKVVQMWFDRCIVFSNNLYHFVPDNVQRIFNKGVVSFDDKFHLVKEEKFSKVFKTPCKGFGAKLYSFLESGRTDIVSNTDENAQKKAWDRKDLINYLKAKSESIYEGLLMLSILFLFADEEIDTGVKALIRHFDLISRNKQSINPRIALMKSFFAVDDLYTKSELYNMINREFIRSKKKYTNNENADRIFSDSLMDEIETDMHLCSLNSAKNLIIEINAESETISKALSKADDLSEKEFQSLKEAEAKLQNKLDKLSEISSLFRINPAHYYNEKLNNSVRDFYKSININEDTVDFKENICRALGDESAEDVMSFLRQSELLMDFQTQLKNIKWQSKIEYTAPLMSLTKALEYIGNLLFKELIKNVNAQTVMNTLPNRDEKSDLRKFYMHGNDWADFITLGSFAHLFTNSEFRGINPNSNNQDTDVKNCYKQLDIHKLINEDRIKRLNGKTAYCEKDTNGIENEHKFTDDFDENLEILGNTIAFVAKNYRNGAAHSNMTDEEKYNQCRKLMITSEHLLWITLYILIDKEENGNKFILGN